jgi:hypothetical protein
MIWTLYQTPVGWLKKNETCAVCSKFGKKVHKGFGREISSKETRGRPGRRWWKRLAAHTWDISTLPSTSRINGWNSQRHAPAVLPPIMTPYPFGRKLSARNSQYGGLRKFSPPPQTQPQPPRAPITKRSARSSTDYAIRITRSRWENINKMNLQKTRGGRNVAQ